MKFIKEYWTQIVVIVIIVGAGSAAYLDWRIDAKVLAKFDEENVVSVSTVEANTESIKDLEAEQSKLDDKVERIVDILLEP
jgi:hypothetical protein